MFGLYLRSASAVTVIKLSSGHVKLCSRLYKGDIPGLQLYTLPEGCFRFRILPEEKKKLGKVVIGTRTVHQASSSLPQMVHRLFILLHFTKKQAKGVVHLR